MANTRNLPPLGQDGVLVKLETKKAIEDSVERFGGTLVRFKARRATNKKLRGIRFMEILAVVKLK